MVSKKNALGKGLSALLENSKTDITSTADNTKDVVVGSISRISINHITPNPFQPRLDFEKEPLLELAESIKEQALYSLLPFGKSEEMNFKLFLVKEDFKPLNWP